MPAPPIKAHTTNPSSSIRESSRKPSITPPTPRFATANKLLALLLLRHLSPRRILQQLRVHLRRGQLHVFDYRATDEARLHRLLKGAERHTVSGWTAICPLPPRTERPPSLRTARPVGGWVGGGPQPGLTRATRARWRCTDHVREVFAIVDTHTKQLHVQELVHRVQRAPDGEICEGHAQPASDRALHIQETHRRHSGAPFFSSTTTSFPTRVLKKL